jgi:hypothetical protein
VHTIQRPLQVLAVTNVYGWHECAALGSSSCLCHFDARLTDITLYGLAAQWPHSDSHFDAVRLADACGSMNCVPSCAAWMPWLS